MVADQEARYLFNFALAISTQEELIMSNLPNNGDQTETTSQAAYAGAKRRIALLEDEIQNLKEAGNKRKSDITTNVTQGRVICRLVSMFDTVNEMVSEFDRRDSLEVGFDEDSEPNEDQNRIFHAYKLLALHIPSFEKKLIDMETNELWVYFKDLKKGAGGSRGDDAANLKPSVVSWMVALFENPNPPLSPTTKADRGFEHDLTGRLLCPMDFDWDDMGVRQKIREGDPNYTVTGDSWPAFLYPHAKGDPSDVEKGLLRSAILVKAYKFIFTSPTSALDIDCEIDVENTAPPLKRAKKNKAPTRGHIANILNMRAVTPRSIAYIAVQVRFALSNAGAWTENDGCFNYATFYNNVVDFFEITPGPTAKQSSQDLLAWWTSKIFGGSSRSGLMSAGLGVRSHVGSSVSRLAVQRAAQEQAVSQ